MQKKFVLVGLVLLLLGVIAGVIGFQSGRQFLNSQVSGDEFVPQAANGKMLNLICDLKVSMPQGDLASPRRHYTQMVIANIDFSNLSGWYQGQFAISESRKGSVTTEGSVLHVRRPALFPRFGAMVAGEEFTIDRSNGEFRQNITLQDGKILELMTGYCGKYAKAPF